VKNNSIQYQSVRWVKAFFTPIRLPPIFMRLFYHNLLFYLCIYITVQALIILWALGLVSSYTMGGFIHILIVLAVVLIVLRVIQGRRVL